MTKPSIPRTCEYCGNGFLAYATDVNHGIGRFCSKKCWNTSRRRPPEERFWEKVEKTEGCWIYRGTIDKNGYGNINIGGRYVRTHRYSYALAYGDFPSHLCVCHKCDNPPCVRPDHLFLGTNADNMADKIQKGRARHAHRLTVEQVREIKQALARGERMYHLSKRYGVSPGAISGIKEGRSWRHV